MSKVYCNKCIHFRDYWQVGKDGCAKHPIDTPRCQALGDVSKLNKDNSCIDFEKKPKGDSAEIDEVKGQLCQITIAFVVAIVIICAVHLILST